jgi:hypothetical protein
MQNKVTITLTHSTKRSLGSPYTLVKMKGSLFVNVRDDADPNKPVNAEVRVGETLTERQAQQLVDNRNFDVTVVPAE